MDMDIFISVIVPIYNIEKYLPACVDSILAQSYENYELLLVNDGSHDKSYEICQNYRDQHPNKIKVINKENGGASSARNAGIKAAAGEYCYFVDGDDIIAKDTLLHFVELIEKYGRVDFIHGRMRFFSDDIEKSIPQPYYLDNSWRRYCATGQEMFVDAYKFQQGLQMGIRGLYKRDFLNDNGLLLVEHKGTWSEDEEWVARVFFNAKTCLGSSHPDYYYREDREGSLTTKMWNLKAGILEINTYRDWVSMAEEKKSTEEFSVTLKRVAGNRFIGCLIDYSSLPGEKLELFLNEAEKNQFIVSYAKPYRYKLVFKTVMLMIKVLGMKNTGRLLHVVKAGQVRRMLKK